MLAYYNDVSGASYAGTTWTKDKIYDTPYGMKNL